MKVCLVQTDLYWEQKEANFAHIEEQLSDLDQAVDWIILPEMFTTGFSVKTTALAEHPNGTTYRWMKQQAAQFNAYISGSFVTTDGPQIKNSLMTINPKGNLVGKYDKRNLFSYGGEAELFSRGLTKETFNIKNEFDCLGLICYDLRFPEWSRFGKPRYDVLFYVANWPKPRIEQWKALLKARAIENQCYVIGVNRVGEDGTGLVYNGGSMAFDCKGDVILDLEEKQCLGVIELSKEKLEEYREKIPFLNDIE